MGEQYTRRHITTMKDYIDIKAEIYQFMCTLACPFNEKNERNIVYNVGSVGCDACKHRISRTGDVVRCGYPGTIKKNTIRRINLRSIR